jgi:hypothetical protein
MTQVPIDSMLVNKFSFGGDLFFSGHTGLPFLMALLFWENLRLRVLFIASSVFFGIIVLMGHILYYLHHLPYSRVPLPEGPHAFPSRITE